MPSHEPLTSNLVARLRERVIDRQPEDWDYNVLRDCADELERLTEANAALDGYWSYECKQNERLRAALEEIATLDPLNCEAGPQELAREAYAETYPVRPLLNAIDAKDAEIERLRALLRQALRDEVEGLTEEEWLQWLKDTREALR